eukprot:scaffold54843_cov67-Phaeocystis_antarctica.AAC.4
MAYLRDRRRSGAATKPRGRTMQSAHELRRPAECQATVASDLPRQFAHASGVRLGTAPECAWVSKNAEGLLLAILWGLTLEEERGDCTTAPCRFAPFHACAETRWSHDQRAGPLNVSFSRGPRCLEVVSVIEASGDTELFEVKVRASRRHQRSMRLAYCYVSGTRPAGERRPGSLVHRRRLQLNLCWRAFFSCASAAADLLEVARTRAQTLLRSPLMRVQWRPHGAFGQRCSTPGWPGRPEHCSAQRRLAKGTNRARELITFLVRSPRVLDLIAVFWLRDCVRGGKSG